MLDSIVLETDMRPISIVLSWMRGAPARTADEGAERSTNGSVSRFGLVRNASRYLESSYRPPTVYTGNRGRHATWLELFFDLVYVVAVAELGLLLHEDLTVTGILSFAGLFVLVWWTWLGFTEYTDAFDTDDLVHRFGMVAAMFGVILLTGTIHDVFHGGSAAFGIAYLFLSLLSVGMYVRAWHSIPSLRSYTSYVLLANGAGALVWALGLFVPEPGRYAIWALSFLISISVAGVYLRLEDIPKRTSHFPERLGLFTILVLGESILAVAVGVSGLNWTLVPALTALSGFLIAVNVWWLYFGTIDEFLLDRSFQAESEGEWIQIRKRIVAHVLVHVFVFIGIVAAGVGVAVAIEAAAEAHALGEGGVRTIAGGLALFLLGSAFTDRNTLESLQDEVFLARGVAGTILGSVALFAPTVSPSAFVGGVAALLVCLTVFEGFKNFLDENTTERL